ncbi:type II secretion system F family protein [Noviherbaspirillum suwonense]|jgi:tight adherence protein B|uniref:Tight adherence protein B n=1 Tax=Noviherbaspirillum suwonense TaxID=1224511 RepID=A0ABY1QD22_9BURK|nr:type II secretion system F family protein [Noviherbaspirillum suwonense]SMP67747.1 tight adherence protein B [Noviherbaspirillum suwonense]
MSNSFDARLAVLLSIAAAAGLLAWLAAHAGSSALSRYRTEFTERTRFQAQEFFLFVDARHLFIGNIAVMLLGAAAAWLVTGKLLVALPVFFALALFPRLLYARMRSRRRQKFEQQLPDALMMLSGGLRAGVGLNAAMQQLVSEAHPPLAQEFLLMLREQRLGVTLEQSLNNLARRMPTQTTVLVVSAMRIASDTGGGLAETLERTAHTIRSRLQMEGKIAALTAQGKLQAWVVSLLPVLLMLVLDQMEKEAMHYLWHTRLGWATLAGIGLLEALGIYVIRRIIAIDV